MAQFLVPSLLLLLSLQSPLARGTGLWDFLLAPILQLEGNILNSIVDSAPPRGQPFPSIRGPRRDDRVCIIGRKRLYISQ